jgi:predicted HTH domain antitoxin
VNFRLGAEEHDRLATAARLFAMRPSTLARVLTMRGVDRALYEKRRDR